MTKHVPMDEIEKAQESADALVCISAAGVRKLLASALIGEDDNRIFVMPVPLLRFLDRAVEGTEETWAECDDGTAGLDGTDDGRPLLKPREGLFESLSAIRTLETDQPFVF